MAQILGSLKLVQAKRVNVEADPVKFRRAKLTRKLDEQISMAKALAEGQQFSVKRTKNVKDAVSGVTQSVEVTRKVKQWWFASENGKVCVQLRYGNKVVDLAKGKNAIEVANGTELIAVLGSLRSAVDGGELDAQITLASDAVKARFKR